MSKTDSAIKEKLKALAKKYETGAFIENDPSRFMHLYSDKNDQEVVAFISANLAFGRRDQILLHIQKILDAAGTSPYEWVLSGGYKKEFPEHSPILHKSFYRIYTNYHMYLFFFALQNILKTDGSLEAHYKKNYSGKRDLCLTIAQDFPLDCALIPHKKESACKKINMFLRWMGRDNSPVDLGLWSSWLKKENLLIPMDTHVICEANKMALISGTNANMKTCILLTDKMNEIFPGDPCKADYALFGLGVDRQLS